MSEILDGRTPLILVSGWNGRTEDVARSLLRDGTVVVHHDLDLLHEGVVRRTVTTLESGAPRERLGILELAHGCISCTLREDLLPLPPTRGAANRPTPTHRCCGASRPCPTTAG